MNSWRIREIEEEIEDLEEKLDNCSKDEEYEIIRSKIDRLKDELRRLKRKKDELRRLKRKKEEDEDDDLLSSAVGFAIGGSLFGGSGGYDGGSFSGFGGGDSGGGGFGGDW